MKRTLVILGLLACGCSAPQSPDMPADRDRLEAVVAECDQGSRRRDCDEVRRALADARREDRMAAYREAF